MDIVLNNPIELIVLGFGLAGFAALAWLRLDLAAVAVVFLAPVYILRIREPLLYPTNALEALIWIMFVVWIVKKLVFFELVEKFSFKEIVLDFARTIKLRLPVVLIFLGAAISIFAGGFDELTASGREHLQTSLGQFLVLFVEPILFFIIARDVWKSDFRGKSDFKTLGQLLFVSYIASAAAVSAISLIGAFSPLRDLFVTFDGRLRGFYLSPNHLAMYIAPAVLLVIGRLADWQIGRLQRSALAIIFVGLLYALYATHSYGAWFGFAGGLSILPLYAICHKPYAIKKRTLLVSFLILFVLGAIFFQEVHGTRFQNMLDERGPVASRLMVWRAAAEILKDHPLWGIGIGTFQDYYLVYQQKFPPYLEWAVPQPHNLFLAFWLQTGLLGLTGFVWLLIVFFERSREAFFNTKVTNYQLLITIIAPIAIGTILLHGLIDTPVFKNDLALVFAVLVGTMLAAAKTSESPYTKDITAAPSV